MKLTNEQRRKRRKQRIRKKIFGTAERPRMVVFRSNRHIYTQLVDDQNGRTIVSASTLSMAKAGESVKLDKDAAVKVGKDVAEKAKANSISQVVFDRNGYKYHGRVKALADSAREAGLEF
ncbi:50S ribosomal protein L18 [Desulfohalovibrio reitneri]|uniref:50S ribosomal protein L18 n=1 Tax=Desulfohalovibrio reitneri TaxID=1307759 RepID=UPI0004A73A35|nr:50S ribosomal protein L18 [Desulfohalovibrio reitneri]